MIFARALGVSASAVRKSWSSTENLVEVAKAGISTY